MNKKVLNEVNRIKKMMSINEVAIYDSTDITNSEITLRINPSTEQNEIVLGGKLPDGTKADDVVYKVNGKFGFFSFPIRLKNISLYNGIIYGKVKSDSLAVRAAFAAIPEKFKDEDGWLIINVPSEKVTQGLEGLKKNNGDGTEISTPEGVTVVLQKK